MRRNILALAAAAGLALGLSQPASAADLGRPVYKAPPPMVVAAYNWSGFYIGVHAGYAWSTEDATNVATGLTTSLDPDGFLGGAQIGWNWQAHGSPWVFGIEGDWSWTNADSSGTVAGLAVTSDHNWYATATARVGYAWDSWLWYVKGGAAWMDADYCRVGTGCAGDTRTGWTAGTGVEWALGPQWSAKLEYNYMDFGSDRFAVLPTNVDFDTQVHAVKLGLNYRFGPWGKGPVVAKY